MAQLDATREETRLLQESYDKHIKSIDGPRDSVLGVILRLENDNAKLEKQLELAEEKLEKQKDTLQETIHHCIKESTEFYMKYMIFQRKIKDAVSPSHNDEKTIIERIQEMQDDLEDLDLALEGVSGDSSTAKVKLLKTARNERDGIYSTLGVSSCLGAHLAIGNLKLAQLDSGILRKAIGDFEDDAAVAEIKRLKKADLELVKVVSALDGVAGNSNVAKIDNLKAAYRNE